MEGRALSPAGRVELRSGDGGSGRCYLSLNWFECGTLVDVLKHEASLNACQNSKHFIEKILLETTKKTQRLSRGEILECSRVVHSQ